MKLQFGNTHVVFELCDTPWNFYHGSTYRMTLTSISLLFVQVSVFTQQPRLVWLASSR